GKVRKAVTGFVSLDAIPLDPHYRKWREAGGEAWDLDEGMLQWGLYAASLRLPFLPTRAGLGADVTGVKTVRSPSRDDELIAMPAIELDVAICHLSRADARGNAQFLGPDLYFDDLYLGAAKRRFISVEKLGLEDTCVHSRKIHRGLVDGVVVAPGGAAP